MPVRKRIGKKTRALVRRSQVPKDGRKNMMKNDINSTKVGDMSIASRFVAFICAVALLNSFAVADNAGVVLMRTPGSHIYHDIVPVNAAHHFYTTIEGPSWENDHCCWRTYLDKDNRNCIDITGKKIYEPTLHHYDEATADVHAIHDWGTDVLVVGSTLGLGAFRLQYGDDTWRNPQLGVNIDSLVVDLIDTTYDSPKFMLAYRGWQITQSAKIDVFWTIETRKEMRSTMCELRIEGPLDNTRVVVGMTKHQGVQLIQDEESHNLITIGVQTEVNDSLMMAIHSDEEYFNSFTSQGDNHAMILDLDEDQIAKWAFVNSWVQEPDPLFKKPHWREDLFNDLPSPIRTAFEQNKKMFTAHGSLLKSRQPSDEWMVVNLAGKTIPQTAVLNKGCEAVRMAGGFYVLRDRNGQCLMQPVISRGR